MNRTCVQKELENRYRKAHNPALRSHYQILWLISEGKSTTQVMEVTGYSRGWIQQLARRYNQGGPEALGDRPHGTIRVAGIGHCSAKTNRRNSGRR